MRCVWETKRTLSDGRQIVVCTACKTKRVIKKPLVRECQPDIEIKKKPCKGCPEKEEPEP